MRKTKITNEAFVFYCFWRWEYIRRNKDYIDNYNLLIKEDEKLYNNDKIRRKKAENYRKKGYSEEKIVEMYMNEVEEFEKKYDTFFKKFETFPKNYKYALLSKTKIEKKDIKSFKDVFDRQYDDFLFELSNFPIGEGFSFELNPFFLDNYRYGYSINELNKYFELTNDNFVISNRDAWTPKEIIELSISGNFEIDLVDGEVLFSFSSKAIKYNSPKNYRFVDIIISDAEDKNPPFKIDKSFPVITLDINLSEDVNTIKQEMEILYNSYKYRLFVDSPSYLNDQYSKQSIQKEEKLKEKYLSSIIEWKKLVALEGISPSRHAYESRAVGLWLWDYINENNCKANDAIRELCSIFPDNYSFDEIDRKFQTRLKDTEKCIAAREVLPLT